MSVYRSGIGGWRCKAHRRLMSRQGAYTVAEMAVVIALIGLLVGTAAIVYARSVSSTYTGTATEMVKEDIRKVYALTNSGVTQNGERKRYSISFNDYDASNNPRNAYRILEGVYSGGTWTTTPMPAEGHVANKVSGTYWIVPSTDAQTKIWFPGGGHTLTIEFISRGSIVETNPAAGATINIGDPGGSYKTITVSGYGSVTSN